MTCSFFKPFLSRQQCSASSKSPCYLAAPRTGNKQQPEPGYFPATPWHAWHKCLAPKIFSPPLRPCALWNVNTVLFWTLLFTAWSFQLRLNSRNYYFNHFFKLLVKITHTFGMKGYFLRALHRQGWSFVDLSATCTSPRWSNGFVFYNLHLGIFWMYTFSSLYIAQKISHKKAF